MKKIISNFIFGIVICMCGYLTIANIFHIHYLNKYETFDFDNKTMVDLKTAITTLEINIEKVSKLDNETFIEEDLTSINNNLNTTLKKIKSNKLLSYNGTTKIYLVDLLNIDMGIASNAIGDIKMLEILAKYDTSITDYIKVYKSEFLNNLFSKEASVQQVLQSYKYSSRDYFNENNFETYNAKVLTRVYELNNYIVEANYFTTLVLEIGGDNNE